MVKVRVITIMKTIAENTVIPMSFVLILLTGVSWVTTLSNRVEAMNRAQEQLEKKQETYNDSLERIITKLSRIEGKIGLSESNR